MGIKKAAQRRLIEIMENKTNHKLIFDLCYFFGTSTGLALIFFSGDEQWRFLGAVLAFLCTGVWFGAYWMLEKCFKASMGTDIPEFCYKDVFNEMIDKADNPWRHKRYKDHSDT